MKASEAFVDEFIAVYKRLGTLEQANKELQTRVLELEAVRAAAHPTVDHADR